jgi:hypothetical protein
VTWRRWLGTRSDCMRPCGHLLKIAVDFVVVVFVRELSPWKVVVAMCATQSLGRKLVLKHLAQSVVAGQVRLVHYFDTQVRLTTAPG